VKSNPITPVNVTKIIRNSMEKLDRRRIPKKAIKAIIIQVKNQEIAPSFLSKTKTPATIEATKGGTMKLMNNNKLIKKVIISGIGEKLSENIERKGAEGPNPISIALNITHAIISKMIYGLDGISNNRSIKVPFRR
jgi:hypothetical protein